MQSEGAIPKNALNYYTILGLSQPHRTISKDELKAAYHRALLLHHPDKTLRSKVDLRSVRDARYDDAQYSVDEIMRAYQTLSDPGLKLEYDKQVSSSSLHLGKLDREIFQQGTHLGVESFDLDDLEYNESDRQWWKSCRCGYEKGYTVTEHDLERESKEGEIYVGCRGCSLFIKVLFGLAEDGHTT